MNFETVTIPCPFKRLVEGRTVEDLRIVSERWFMSDLVMTVDTKTGELLQDSEEDLGSLVYKMLPMEDKNTLISDSRAPFSAWQVCPSARQHKDGYQLDTPIQNLDVQGTNKAVTFRKCPQFFTPPRCSLRTNEDPVDQNNCIELDCNVKDIGAKSVSLDWSKNTDGGVCGRFHRNTRSALSPAHTNFQFCHSYHSTFYMKSYREQITDERIKKHIQRQLIVKNRNIPVLRKPWKKANEAKSISTLKSSSFFRFRMKGKNAYVDNILKVGPCPTRPDQSTPIKATLNCNTAALNRGKIKAKPNAKLTVEEKFNEGKELKSVTTLEFQQIAPVRKENVASEPINEVYKKDGIKIECTAGKLKTVQLQLQSSTDSPRLVLKGRSISQSSKTRVKSVGTKPAAQWNRDSSDMPYDRKITRKTAFRGKEFLRIISPKPLICNQTVSHMSSDYGESPSFSLEKSMEVSPTRSPISSISGTSLRSQSIADVLMKRVRQVVFPKNSKFQACITPSNHSSSSVASQIRHQRTDTPKDTEKDVIEENIHNTHQVSSSSSSKSSFPKIGPFIFG
ncbi:hypothetical protein AWC38_SpisGene11018 [Stylophora pistillata]|uniref:Ig-like domain-containing protein n=1 Tax=Stylophora pistillata TaxID=50429 RepID=A0A2B4S105_STYPI|nr:hypothetical protein AWC38_SpisGene11018 [Stylophora pistillata]